jgi:beta-glucosidase
VQVYAQYPGSRVSRPLRELKGFERISLQAGETKTVRINLRPDAFAYWDVGKRAFVTERGPVKILIARSSADVTLERTIQVQ